jgi:DNA-binding protein H-NS
MMNSNGQPALDTLSLTALQALLAQTNAAIEDRRVEELKVLADGYAKKLQMNGFSIREGMDALKPYLPAKRERAQAM